MNFTLLLSVFLLNVFSAKDNKKESENEKKLEREREIEESSDDWFDGYF